MAQDNWSGIHIPIITPFKDDSVLMKMACVVWSTTVSRIKRQMVLSPAAPRVNRRRYRTPNTIASSTLSSKPWPGGCR